MVNLILMTRENCCGKNGGNWGTTVCVCVCIRTMVSNRRGLQPPPTSANPRAITSDNMKQAREGSYNCIKTAQQEGKWKRVYLMREGSLHTWPDQPPSSRLSIMLPHPQPRPSHPPHHHVVATHCQSNVHFVIWQWPMRQQRPAKTTPSPTHHHQRLQSTF